MSDSTIESNPSLDEKNPWPLRAIASMMFALFSFLGIWVDLRISERLGRLMNALESAKYDWVRENVSLASSGVDSDLVLSYRALAVTALIWCIWSWRRESGPLVGLAVFVTMILVLVNLLFT